MTAVATVTELSVSRGPTSGGTIVTVTGTDFQNTASCLFGGATASTTFVSTSTVKCSAPATAASTVTLEVRYNGYESTADNLPFIFDGTLSM